MRLAPHPDRLFPADPATRDIARSLHASVADAPIVSPHGHVPAELLRADEAFSDPASLLISPDHYVTRLLHASGVPLERLGAGGHPAEPREVWRLFSAHWDDFLGTPVRFWLETELAEVFGIDEQPSAVGAERVYDALAARLAEPEFRPRALFDRFRIDVLATTDDPADDLAAHRALAADPSFSGRVLPTMRADAYMNPADTGWAARLDRLAEASGIDCGTHAGLLDALRDRRAFAKSLGSTATDCGTADAWAEPLERAEAERIHRAGLTGTATAADAVAYRRDLLYRFAEMAADDGLVMQLHTGVLRNHHAGTLARFGPDTGHDLPVTSTFVEPLRRMLNDFGTNPAFRIVLFTVDETTFSREIAPLAGFYPSVYVGAPWWFLDAPAAIGRFRAAATETAGFRKTSGFIDDTRAFCSIPARHDMSRRADAAYLAGLVTTHQLDEADAHRLARDLVSAIPRETFRLGAETTT
ncbi:glucuronate isomerase [Herbiconiux sp. P17]|uniref:glucuronate isomerase n=1 Tax=Herbiconiux wuyangfengii TaxID=3342794 RepID=UPI0035BA019A